MLLVASSAAAQDDEIELGAAQVVALGGVTSQRTHDAQAAGTKAVVCHVTLEVPKVARMHLAPTP